MELTFAHLIVDGYNYYLKVGEPLHFPIGSARMVKSLKIQEDKLHVETHPPITWTLSFPVETICKYK